MTHCSLCEARVDESMAFCETCGKELDWPNADKAQQTSPLPPPEEPVISPTKLRPKKERKPINKRKVLSYSTIAILVICLRASLTYIKEAWTKMGDIMKMQ